MTIFNPIAEISDYIQTWLKSLQVYVDNLSPVPDADNTMLPLVGLPYQFDATALAGTTLSKCSNDYIDSEHGYGYQQVGFTHRVTLINNELRLTGLNFQGKILTGIPGTWDKLASSEQEDAIAQCENVFDVRVANDYPDSKIYLTYSGGNVVFNVQGHTNSLHLEYNTKDGWTRVINSGYSIALTNNRITDAGNELISGPFSIMPTNSEYVMNNTAIIAIMNSDTYAQRLANDIPSVNRSTMTKVCLSGATYKLYYGDTYLIYAIDDSKIYTYYDMYEGTKTAAQQINDWIPGSPVIHVPTYEENKYGPQPEPGGIDDDIETDMELNDAAFGEGLSHYYVTTVDAPVLNDISAAMSTWDINNTGKDLYKNLLSCRITKVGPIPSAPSTFVIYGEELLYNGSPITITKITGNPSMDLGEYEITPKFNDFRDYAPYTKIEMFIPYCGWVALPSHCMSSAEEPKIITGTLLCDIIAGTCKAVIKCNDTVIAEAAGFAAVDVPFTGENVGMKMAGVASAITSYGKAAAGTIGGIAGGMPSGGSGKGAAAAGAGAAGGIVSALGSFAQMYSAFNANYTEICGKTGDGCNVAGLSHVYIKIQRPKTAGFPEPNYVPEDYGHTTGFICMVKKELSELSGFTVCANVDTSGIAGATERERQLIKNYLESGVIIVQPEE